MRHWDIRGETGQRRLLAPVIVPARNRDVECGDDHGGLQATGRERGDQRDTRFGNKTQPNPQAPHSPADRQPAETCVLPRRRWKQKGL